MAAENPFIKTIKGFESNPIVLDFSLLREAQKALNQIELTSLGSAPGMLQKFILASSSLIGYKAQILRQIPVGERKRKSRKAIVLLDEAGTALQSKGLTTSRSPSGSADLREALVDQDAEITQIVTDLGELEAALQFIQDQQEILRMAYDAVKKIMDKIPLHVNG